MEPVKPIPTISQLLGSERAQTDKDFRIAIVGRALVALFGRQTQDEKQVNDTKHTNARGFSSSDAKSGSISAKTFIKYGTLKDFQLDQWMAPMRNGRPKIVKYEQQLLDIARAKQEKSS